MDFKLETKRLILRPHCSDDIEFMVELNDNPEVIRYVGGEESLTPEMAQTIVNSLLKQFAERRMGRFIVIEKESGRKIGWCGLKWTEESQVDLGYRFLQSEWGKGFATEAAKCCLEYGFQTLGIKSIMARVAIQNLASINVLEKLGMSRCGQGVDHGLEYIEFFITINNYHLCMMKK